MMTFLFVLSLLWLILSLTAKVGVLAYALIAHKDGLLLKRIKIEAHIIFIDLLAASFFISYLLGAWN